MMKLADYLDIIGFPVIKMLKRKNDYPEEKSVIIIFVIYKFIINIANLLAVYYYVRNMTNIISIININDHRIYYCFYDIKVFF